MSDVRSKPEDVEAARKAASEVAVAIEIAKDSIGAQAKLRIAEPYILRAIEDARRGDREEIESAARAYDIVAQQAQAAEREVERLRAMLRATEEERDQADAEIERLKAKVEDHDSARQSEKERADYAESELVRRGEEVEALRRERDEARDKLVTAESYQRTLDAAIIAADKQIDRLREVPGLLAKAARQADWRQVVLNGGPPCFHLETDGRFCLRAERWAGHTEKEEWPEHRFVSLAALLAEVRREETKQNREVLHAAYRLISMGRSYKGYGPGPLSEPWAEYVERWLEDSIRALAQAEKPEEVKR